MMQMMPQKALQIRDRELDPKTFPDATGITSDNEKFKETVKEVILNSPIDFIKKVRQSYTPKNNKIGYQRKKMYNKYKWIDCYNYYKDTVEPGLQLSKEQYMKLVPAGYNSILERMIKLKEKFELPSGMGTFEITKKRMSFKIVENLPVDFEQSKKLNKLIRHTNSHRNSFLYKIDWRRPSQNKAGTKFIYLYRFKAKRGSKIDPGTRMLAFILKKIPTGLHDYVEKTPI